MNNEIFLKNSVYCGTYHKEHLLQNDNIKPIEKFPIWSESYPYPQSDHDGIGIYKNTDSSNDDDDWDSDTQPRGERWPPLGAPNDEECGSLSANEDDYRYKLSQQLSNEKDIKRLKELEEEQEELNNSLLALTSHFAQVQFRLKQIVDASAVEKEKLLIELEEFANRGIPDLRQNSSKSPILEEETKGQDNAETRLDIGQERQKELIEQLKQQLEDLENYAYQTGDAGLPQSIILKKQRAIIDQLKGKLNINVDDFDKLTIDDLKQQVDSALKELINPLRMKEQLVTQLQTQIVDLERFIEFLQDGGPEPFQIANLDGSACKCEGHIQPELINPRVAKERTRRSNSFSRENKRQQLNRGDTDTLVSKASTLLSMLTFAQFSCGTDNLKFEKNTLKKTASGYHWGDLRASLEVAIATVVELAGTVSMEETDCSIDREERTDLTVSCESITLAVRKKLAPALRDLMQHGLMPVSHSQSLVPFLACFPQRSHKSPQLLHAWDLILRYYNMKKGDQYNETPARRLSQSFNLEISGSSITTNKQLLLQTIGNIVSTHGPLKRSYDSHFKAFLSTALNKKKLVMWLRLIFRTQSLVENYYQSWSYVAKTGFEDSFRSLEQLVKINFDLPEDMALKTFQNIKDVF